MIRQVKRVMSPCLLVTNHEAQLFPGVMVKQGDGKPSPITFDRILCDVPCSGDGTLRKNIPIWNDWAPHQANSLHSLVLGRHSLSKPLSLTSFLEL
jgi:16S rRNA C967 or C1407 C5-methylase (RsmB/RsmF family)